MERKFLLTNCNGKAMVEEFVWMDWHATNGGTDRA